MALTATATKSLRASVCRTLGMKDPYIVTISPDKCNITFCVSKFESLDATFNPLIERLRQQRTNMDRTIIFCKQQETCARLYLMFRLRLNKEFTHPIGYPDLPQFRLVDMFTSGTHSSVKETISSAFSTTSSHLRVFIATVAFGMGVNPPNVHYIIHCGPPNDVETYVQEVGRGGRDGSRTYAILYYSAQLKRFVDQNMLDYCEQDKQCRRDKLFSDFDQYTHSPENTGCRCCDVCKKHCTCGNCFVDVSDMLC